MSDREHFRKFIQEVEPIRMKEPLAAALGAFTDEDAALLEYSYLDAIKAAGHACPTVTGAYLCCQEALRKLYPDTTPVRGEIKVTVYGAADEGVNGVMGQVFGYITGAAPETGFKGLGPKFRRKELLKYSDEEIDPQAACFEFGRMDNGKSVLVKFYPWLIPFDSGKAQRVGELIEKVVIGAASPAERQEFQDLWMEKIEGMIVTRREIESWLKVEE